MRRIYLLSLLFLAACMPNNLQPYYSDEYLVNPPARLTGDFAIMIYRGDILDTDSQYVWSFGSEIVAYDKKGVKTKVNPTYFEIDEELYCDIFIKRPDKKLGNIFLAHVIPVHALYKVEYVQEGFLFVPLDVDFVVKKIKSGEITIEHIDNKDMFVFNGKPKEWHRVISKYQKSDLFPHKNRFYFKSPI